MRKWQLQLVYLGTVPRPRQSSTAATPVGMDVRSRLINEIFLNQTVWRQEEDNLIKIKYSLDSVLNIVKFKFIFHWQINQYSIGKI